MKSLIALILLSLMTAPAWAVVTVTTRLEDGGWRELTTQALEIPDGDSFIILTAATRIASVKGKKSDNRVRIDGTQTIGAELLRHDFDADLALLRLKERPWADPGARLAPLPPDTGLGYPLRVGFFNNGSTLRIGLGDYVAKTLNHGTSTAPYVYEILVENASADWVGAGVYESNGSLVGLVSSFYRPGGEADAKPRRWLPVTPRQKARLLITPASFIASWLRTETRPTLWMDWNAAFEGREEMNLDLRGAGKPDGQDIRGEDPRENGGLTDLEVAGHGGIDPIGIGGQEEMKDDFRVPVTQVNVNGLDDSPKNLKLRTWINALDEGKRPVMIERDAAGLWRVRRFRSFKAFEELLSKDSIRVLVLAARPSDLENQVRALNAAAVDMVLTDAADGVLQQAFAASVILQSAEPELWTAADGERLEKTGGAFAKEWAILRDNLPGDTDALVKALTAARKASR